MQAATERNGQIIITAAAAGTSRQNEDSDFNARTVNKRLTPPPANDAIKQLHEFQANAGCSRATPVRAHRVAIKHDVKAIALPASIALIGGPHSLWSGRGANSPSIEEFDPTIVYDAASDCEQSVGPSI